jgi:hypothetical protein
MSGVAGKIRSAAIGVNCMAGSAGCPKTAHSKRVSPKSIAVGAASDY